MLEIHIPIGTESFNEATNEFVEPETYTIELEHSLASLSKWESKYEKPFLADAPKTVEETFFYIQECMLLSKNPGGKIWENFSQEHYDQVQTYLESKQSATTIKQKPGGGRQILTAEVIYGWMFALKIPLELQHWHLNKLLMQINVCNEQRNPPKKMSRTEEARSRADLNAKRRAQLGTKG